VLWRTERREGQWFWFCECGCGTHVEICARYLLKAQRKSCGCQDSRATIGARTMTHGATKTAEYHIWAGMLDRCRNVSSASYKDYGGRGIIVDPRWFFFENFREDMGLRPSSDLSLERKDNDGPYCKDNCVWAPRVEQANNRRSNRVFEYNGERLTLMQLARKYFPDEPVDRARCRVQRRVDTYGLSVEQAVELPIRVVVGQPLLASA
jgi:hypothetical protein